MERAIIKTDLKIPDKLAFTLHNVLTPEKCQELIKISEEGGYELATLAVEPGVQVTQLDTRNNYRHIRDDVQLAAFFFSSIKPYLPTEWLPSAMIQRDLIGVNERLRFLRYEPGQKFARHMDGWFSRENGERSYLTVQFYLNEGFVGGDTTFLLNEDRVRIPVVPKVGMALIFQHDIVHEGSMLYEGKKYCIRSDIMYTNKIKGKP